MKKHRYFSTVRVNSRNLYVFHFYKNCFYDWQIKLLGNATQEHRILAELLSQQLDISEVKMIEEPSEAYCLTSNYPTIEISIPRKISEEKAEKTIYALHSLLNASYLLIR